MCSSVLPCIGPDVGLTAWIVLIGAARNCTQSSLNSWPLSVTSRQYAPVARGIEVHVIIEPLTTTAGVLASPKRHSYSSAKPPSNICPVIRTSVSPPIGPRSGLSEMIRGCACIAKGCASKVNCCPLRLTSTSTLRIGSATGVWQSRLEALVAVPAVVAATPKRHVSCEPPGAKPLPLRLTRVPPLYEAEFG